MSLPPNSLNNVHEMLHALEEGTKLTRHYHGKREIKHVQVKLETRELIWTRNAGGRPEGTGPFNCYTMMAIMLFSTFAVICHVVDYNTDIVLLDKLSMTQWVGEILNLSI